MQRKQYLFLGIALIAFAGLYFGGQMVNKNASVNTTHEEHATGAKEVQPLNIEDFIREQKLVLKPDSLRKVQGLESALVSENSAVNNKNLAEFWQNQPNLPIAAHYYKKGAFLENTEKSLTFAGRLFLDYLLPKEERPEMRQWIAREAMACFEKASELNPNNVDTKIALATCYTDGTGETMKGVTLLREITQQDSTNVPANLILGKLAIQSGQWDRAIKRLKTVLSKDPNQTEAMYHLAEAYKGNGETNKAVETLETFKRKMKDPELVQKIDEYIKTLK